MLPQLLDWLATSAAVVLVAFAGTILTMKSVDFKAVRVCFSIAACFFLMDICRWLVLSRPMSFSMFSDLLGWTLVAVAWYLVMNWVNKKEVESGTPKPKEVQSVEVMNSDAIKITLDEKLWQANRWNVINRDLWYDGSFPTMREIKQLSDLGLQKRYLSAIQENRNRGIEEGDCYFKGDAILCRIEMGRRLDGHLVQFDQEQQ